MCKKLNGKRTNFKCNDIKIDRITFNRILKQVAPNIEKSKDLPTIGQYIFGTGQPITIVLKEPWYNPNL